MKSHPFYGRPVRDIDRDPDVLAQLAAALIVENHAHHLHVQARRARITKPPAGGAPGHKPPSTPTGHNHDRPDRI